MFLLACQQLARAAPRASPRSTTLLPSSASFTSIAAASKLSPAAQDNCTPSTHSILSPHVSLHGPTAVPTQACSVGATPHPLLSCPARLSPILRHYPFFPNSISRGFATSAPPTPPTTTSPEPDNDIYILPMPRLSHEMEVGIVVKWLKKEGDAIDMYDLLCEVSTDTLVTAEFKEGAFAGTVNLLIESQEYGVLSRVLVQEGQCVKVGTPIAVVAEGPGSPPSVMASDYLCETSDVYDAAQPQVKVLTWQSYLAGPKDGEDKAAGGASGSCM